MPIIPPTKKPILQVFQRKFPRKTDLEPEIAKQFWMDGNGEKTPIFHVKVWFIIQMRQPIKSASLGCQGSIKIFRWFSQFESSVSPTGYPKHVLIKICFFSIGWWTKSLHEKMGGHHHFHPFKRWLGWRFNPYFVLWDLIKVQVLLPIWDQGNYASLSVYFSPFISMANFYSTNMADGDPSLSIGTTFSGFFCQVFCQKVRLFFYRYSFLGVRPCDLSCFCRSLAKIRNFRKMLPSNS